MRKRQFRSGYVDTGWCEEAFNKDLPWPVRLRAFAFCQSAQNHRHVRFGPGELAKKLTLDRGNLTRTIDTCVAWGLLGAGSIPRCLVLPLTFFRLATDDDEPPGEFCQHADEHRAAERRRALAAWEPKKKRPAPKVGTKYVPDEGTEEGVE